MKKLTEGQKILGRAKDIVNKYDYPDNLDRNTANGLKENIIGTMERLIKVYENDYAGEMSLKKAFTTRLELPEAQFDNISDEEALIEVAVFLTNKKAERVQWAVDNILSKGGKVDVKTDLWVPKRMGEA